MLKITTTKTICTNQRSGRAHRGRLGKYIDGSKGPESCTMFMEKHNAQTWTANLIWIVLLGSPEPRQKPQQLELEDGVPKKPPAADSKLCEQGAEKPTTHNRSCTQLSGPSRGGGHNVDSDTGKPSRREHLWLCDRLLTSGNLGKTWLRL